MAQSKSPFQGSQFTNRGAQHAFNEQNDYFPGEQYSTTNPRNFLAGPNNSPNTLGFTGSSPKTITNQIEAVSQSTSLPRPPKGAVRSYHDNYR